jgi:hypothetical protein
MKIDYKNVDLRNEMYPFLCSIFPITEEDVRCKLDYALYYCSECGGWCNRHDSKNITSIPEMTTNRINEFLLSVRDISEKMK